MQESKVTAINWESQRVLSQIANQINQPLEDIRRLLRHIQSKTANTDVETNRLSAIMLESSEQIESLLDDILKIEANNRIEVLVHNKFRHPGLYRFDHNNDNTLSGLLESDVPTDESRISKADLDWLIQVEKTILDNIDFYGLNVSWLAKQMAVSERQIFRKIDKYTGLTPNKYIRSLRLFKAKELLENYTFSTVNEVASAVGLKDPYYFSNLYKKQFGKKPKEYLV